MLSTTEVRIIGISSSLTYQLYFAGGQLRPLTHLGWSRCKIRYENILKCGFLTIEKSFYCLSRIIKTYCISFSVGLEFLALLWNRLILFNCPFLFFIQSFGVETNPIITLNLPKGNVSTCTMACKLHVQCSILLESKSLEKFTFH